MSEKFNNLPKDIINKIENDASIRNNLHYDDPEVKYDGERTNGNTGTTPWEVPVAEDSEVEKAKAILNADRLTIPEIEEKMRERDFLIEKQNDSGLTPEEFQKLEVLITEIKAANRILKESNRELLN